MKHGLGTHAGIAHFTVGAAQSESFKAALPHWTMLEDAREFGFPLAADIMKSEMRGTISDLKREPLKTP